VNISKNKLASGLPKDGYFQPETLDPGETEILQILFRRESVSRAEIAELTRWSRQRVYQRMHRLAGRGLVEEIEGHSSANRQKTRVFRIVKNRVYLAGIEIQKAGLQIVLSDITGELLHERSETIAGDRRPDEILSSACQLLAGMLADLQDGGSGKLAGIAVSVRGTVDATNTWIVHSSSLTPAWESFDIRNYLQGRFPSAAVLVESDVNIMALSEQRLLSGSKTKDLVYIHIGEDIRAGIVLSGKLHR
jgi:DNA-binding MarR family transcriptional regulator